MLQRRACVGALISMISRMLVPDVITKRMGDG